jgi:hypothetical protein
MAEAVSESELWLVQLSPTETRALTLEQVDEAYQAGAIHEGTLICEAGTGAWQPLYVVAGLEPPRMTTPGAPPPPAPLAAPVPPSNVDLPPPSASPRSAPPTPSAAPRTAPPTASAAPRTAPPTASAASRSAPPTPRVMTTTQPVAAKPISGVPRPAVTAPKAPPAGAPAPPGAQQLSRSSGQIQAAPSVSRLPSAKAPPLPSNYMASKSGRGSSSSIQAGGASRAKAAPNGTSSANATGVRTTASVNVGVSTHAHSTSVPSAATAPTPLGESASPASSQAPTVRGKVPPLPPNAFSHLAAEALAEFRAPPPVAMPALSQTVPLPAMPSAAPVPAAFAPTPAPYSVPPTAAATSFTQHGIGPELAPPVSYGPASHGPASYSPVASTPIARPLSEPEATIPTQRARAEWPLLGLIALVGLSITLYRNSVLYDLSTALGAQSTYLSIEKAVVGEPSVSTPRGVQLLLQRTEKSQPSRKRTSE